MTTRIKNLFLFLWRMIYPLILYQFIVSAVMFIAFIIIIGYGLSGASFVPDTVYDELSNQLSLLLTGLGAVFASIPLGILYVLFRCKQHAARQQEQEIISARQQQEELWASVPQLYEFHGAESWTQEPAPGELCSGKGHFGGVYSAVHPPDKIQTIPPKPVLLHMNLREFLRITVLGFSMCICLNALLLSLPIPWDSFEETGDLLYTPPFIHQVLCIGLIVPFAEELVFRGLGYAKMRLMLPMVPAMIISALYFGIYHGNLVQGIYASVLGLVLAWIMESYDSLLAVCILHASANIMSILLSNTVIGVFLCVFTLRCGLILICGGITIFILYKMREDRLDYETSVNCNTML